MQHLQLHHRRALIAAAIVSLAAGSWLATSTLSRQPPPVPRFAADIQPIFDRKCVTCHPVAYPYLDLRAGRSYRDLYRASAATDPAFERVVPGRPDLSYLLIHPPEPSLRGLLMAGEIRTITRWIAAGAPND